MCFLGLWLTIKVPTPTSTTRECFLHPLREVRRLGQGVPMGKTEDGGVEGWRADGTQGARTETRQTQKRTQTHTDAHRRM